jgi:hypothetical protein
MHETCGAGRIGQEHLLFLCVPCFCPVVPALFPSLCLKSFCSSLRAPLASAVASLDSPLPCASNLHCSRRGYELACCAELYLNNRRLLEV